MAFEFVEFVQGSIRNRNCVTTIDKAKVNGQKRECYRSLFRFNEDFKKHVDKTLSTAAYKGPHWAECLFFDFDNENNLEAVKEEVVSFLHAADVTYGIPIDYWRIAFSGAKGFHLALPIGVCGDVLPSNDFAAAYKNVCLELCSGFKAADRSIYNINRIIRMQGSINAITGLYKIPLTYSDLATLPIDAIKQMAQVERSIDAYPLSEIIVIPCLQALWEKYSVTQYSSNPSMVTASETVGLFAPAEEGDRNNKAISICGVLIERGFSEKDAYACLEMWNAQNRHPLPKQEVVELVEGAFRRYGKAVAENKCVDICSLTDAEKEYERIIDTPESEKIKFGISALDKKIRSFTAGMVCSIVAKSSNGKSSFVQSALLRHAKLAKKPVIFFSLEMPLSLVFERTLQSEMDRSGYDLERSYKSDRLGITQKSALIQTNLRNFFICTKSSLTLEEIGDTVKAVEKKTGQRVSLIAIDYLSLLGGKGKDIFEKTAINALGMKQLAKNLGIAVIFLAQTTKQLTIYDELDENAGKDAGSILEASDFQLTLWRTKDEDAQMDLNEWIDFKLRITKNRNGHQGSIFAIRMNKFSTRWEDVSDKEGKDYGKPIVAK